MSDPFDFGGFRAYVGQTVRWHEVGLWLVRRRVFNGVREYAVAAPVELEWQPHDEAYMLPDRPSLLLPNDLARSVVDELTTHFGGVPVSALLRRDFEHERGRVDTLTAAVIEIAKGGNRG